MRPEHVERVASRLSIPTTFVVELCTEGIVDLDDELIAEHVVERVRVCWTLREELGVNLAGVEVILHLLRVIERDRRLMSGRDR